MVQNLRVDIIYYKSASDFEMEFNLGGCCRMRTLSDKTDDKKGFIKALVRGVDRSRVIIACGPLFSADGLINLVATAIGTSTAVCDNKTYGINSNERIDIINGSTPLVTPDGYFGGCIIESGPQTIILLTENRAFRKAIMQNLIHPYIEEISYIPARNAVVKPQVTEDTMPEVSAADEAFLTEPDENYEFELGEDIYEETMPVTDEHNIEFIMDGEAEEEETATPPAKEETVFDDTYRMYTEPETPEEIKSRYENPYKPSESDNMFITEPQYDDENNGGNTRSLDIAIIVLVLLLLLAVLALAYFIVLKPMTMGISTGEYLKQIFSASSAMVRFLK